MPFLNNSRRLMTARHDAPRLMFAGGHATGGDLTPTGTLPGDLMIAFDTQATTTPPAAGSGFTSITTGSSDETTDCAFRLTYKWQTSADETITTAGASRRGGVVLRNVDPKFDAYLATGVTHITDTTTGANILAGALTPPRAGIFLTFVRQSGTNTNTFTGTLLHTQNAANAEVQIYWTSTAGLTAAGSLGTAVTYQAAQTYALGTSTNARGTCVLWIPVRVL
jgi:hypothetical protein